MHHILHLVLPLVLALSASALPPTANSRNSIPPGFLVSTPHRVPQNVLAYNPISFGSMLDGRRRVPPNFLLSLDQPNTSLDSTSKSKIPKSSSLGANDPIRFFPPSSPNVAVIPSSDQRIHYKPLQAWQAIRGPAFLTRTTQRTREVGKKEPRTFATSELPTISFSFVGRGIKWYGSKSPQHGQAMIKIDGKVMESRVDAYSPRWLDQQLIFSAEELKHGRHEIEIISLGTKQRRSEGTTIDLDAFVVLDGVMARKVGGGERGRVQFELGAGASGGVGGGSKRRPRRKVLEQDESIFADSEKIF